MGIDKREQAGPRGSLPFVQRVEEPYTVSYRCRCGLVIQRGVLAETASSVPIAFLCRTCKQDSAALYDGGT